MEPARAQPPLLPPAGRSDSRMRSVASSTAASTRRIPMAPVSLPCPIGVAVQVSSLRDGQAAAAFASGTGLTNYHSPRNIHHPHTHHRILLPSLVAAPAASANARHREASRHHSRRSQIGSGPPTQVQGEPERHVFDRQDLEPRRLIGYRILHRPSGPSKSSRVGR